MAFLVSDIVTTVNGVIVQNAVLKTENAVLRTQLSAIRKEEEVPDAER